MRGRGGCRNEKESRERDAPHQAGGGNEMVVSPGVDPPE
jgi:hypothetical protein